MSMILVLGGTRSGKSAHAERLAATSCLPVRYVATADGSDPSLAPRIAAHVARRPAAWETVEAGPRIADALAGADGRCVIVDGLGPWIATALHRAGAFEDSDPELLASVEQETLAELDRLAAAASVLAADGGRAIVVAELAGEGLLPPDRASRVWLDVLGAAAQRLAAAADHVELCVAGRVMPLPPAEPAQTAQPAPPFAQHAPPFAQPAPPFAQTAPASAQPAPPFAQHAPPFAQHAPPFAQPAPPFAQPAPPFAQTAAASAQPAPPFAQHAPPFAHPAPPPDLAALRTHGDTAVRPGDADHAVNVMAGGPPAWLREELRAALDGDADRYPSEQAAARALAALHGRTPEEIVPVNGAAQALWLLPAALRPALAACVHPGFTEAEAALHAHGVPVTRVLRDPARGFALDPDAVPPAADLVIVGNPASPSGTLDPAAALHALRRPGRTLVVDEAFMDLVPGEPASLVREPLPDVIVTRSLTKSLAIPGLRAGYAVAAAPLAERLRSVRPPWSVNALALAALTAVAARPHKLAALAERAQQERADLQRRLAAVGGVRTWPAAANYCLVEVPDGAAVAAALRERGIAVREAASFPGLDARHLRLTARSPEENARLAEVLAEAVRACA